jgi:bile acid-coenzyme A ligase
MFHGGFLEPHNGLAMGHKLVVMEVFSPNLFLQLVERHRVNFVVLVPTLMRALASVKDVDRYDLSSIEALYRGSGPCTETVKRRWLELLPPERVFEDYGSIEDIGFVTIRGDEWLNHPGSVGRSSKACRVFVLDGDGNEAPAGEVGEVYFHSPRIAQPHYISGGAPLYERAGGLTVGDLGYLDDQGYLHLVDRRADMLNVGGLNVYPAKVEAVILELDSVVDAAVVGRPDELFGHRVHAVVVAAEGRSRQAAAARPMTCARSRPACSARPAPC